MEIIYCPAPLVESLIDRLSHKSLIVSFMNIEQDYIIYYRHNINAYSSDWLIAV